MDKKQQIAAIDEVVSRNNVNEILTATATVTDASRVWWLLSLIDNFTDQHLIRYTSILAKWCADINTIRSFDHRLIEQHGFPKKPNEEMLAFAKSASDVELAILQYELLHKYKTTPLTAIVEEITSL